MIGAVAKPPAFFGALAQERIHRLTLRHGVFRKLVAKIGEDKFEAGRKLGGVGDRLGQVGEKALHPGGGFEVALGVRREQAAGRFESDLVPHAGEHVEDFAFGGSGVADTVRCDQRKAQGTGELDERLVARLFLAISVALDLGVDVVPAERGDQALNALAAAAREADQSFRIFGDIFGRRRAFVLFRTQLSPGDQPAQVSVAGSIAHQQWINSSIGTGDLRADVRADAGLLGGEVKAGRAVQAIAIEQRDGGKLQLGGLRRDRFGQGSAAQEAEGRPCVQLHVVSHRSLRRTIARRGGRGRADRARRR